ncbi:MAG: hypothetical protein OER80_11310 [Gammaproteobacteria bacterium]|nr:hypothetical protein [Gammaproteobacteria bacterium]MDH3766951.1 hypothetical protein [Gammaproteobacteria bacterium]
MNYKNPGSHAGAVLLTLLLGPLSFTSAHGFSSGVTISTATQESCGDAACHSAGTVEVLITGPDVVLVDSTHALTMTITGGPGADSGIGGLNVFASGGTLIATDPLTRLLSEEIVHNSPGKDFSGSTVSWQFDWTAPSVIGMVDFMAFGVSAIRDFNAANDFAGDNLTMPFTISVVQVIPIPAALLLFSSGLAVLGWTRRRPTS